MARRKNNKANKGCNPRNGPNPPHTARQTTFTNRPRRNSVRVTYPTATIYPIAPARYQNNYKNKDDPIDITQQRPTGHYFTVFHTEGGWKYPDIRQKLGWDYNTGMKRLAKAKKDNKTEEASQLVTTLNQIAALIGIDEIVPDAPQVENEKSEEEKTFEYIAASGISELLMPFLRAARGDKVKALEYQRLTEALIAIYNVSPQYAFDTLVQLNWVFLHATNRMNNIIDYHLGILRESLAVVDVCLPAELHELVSLQANEYQMREHVLEILRLSQWDEKVTADNLKVSVLTIATGIDWNSAYRILTLVVPEGDLTTATNHILAETKLLHEQTGFGPKECMECLKHNCFSDTTTRQCLKQKLVDEIVQTYGTDQEWAHQLCNAAGGQRQAAHRLAKDFIFTHFSQKTGLDRKSMSALLRSHDYNTARVEQAIVEYFVEKTELHEDGCRDILTGVDWNLALAEQLYERLSHGNAMPNHFLIGR
ncbi:hypothetical protein EJ08DRAFT_645577, partial [Tothia fuscella]